MSKRSRMRKAMRRFDASDRLRDGGHWFVGRTCQRCGMDSFDFPRNVLCRFARLRLPL